MRTVLIRRPDGLCERISVDMGELTPTGETSPIVGWTSLDGCADIYTGPAAGEYLVPRKS